MRTAKENRGKGYATELLRYALSQYKGRVCGDCTPMSKNVFRRLGFDLVHVAIYGEHIVYHMERVI